MNLRTYQRDALDAIKAEWEQHQSTLLVLPTGCGKTVTFAHAIAELCSGRAMVIAHREELIHQAARTIEAITGTPCDIEMADNRADTNLFRKSRVVVASKDSLHRRRLAKFNPDEFGLLIIDEAHHAVAASYCRVMDHFKQNPDLRVLGVTATPDRLDEKALGRVFESAAYVYEVLDAIDDGYLVPIRQRTVSVAGLDFSGVKTVAGDFNQKDLNALMEFEQNLHAVADPIVRLSRWNRTLIFAAGVRHAERLAEILNRHRAGSARFVCGATPKDERQQVLRDYREDRFQHLVSVGVFTEGFDDPGIGMVAIARPTKSRALYAQMCLDAETEILTNRGWRRIDDRLEPDEQAAAFDMADSSIRWSPIENEVRRFGLPEETAWGIENPHCNIRVTNQHNMVVRRRHGRDRTRTPWQLVKAEDVPSMADAVEFPVCGFQDATGVALSNDDIRFIGLWMTDGNLNPRNGQITLYQSERYPAAIEYIERVIASCNFKCGHRIDIEPSNFGERTPLHRWTISRGAPRGRDKDKTGWGRLAGFLDKDLSPLLEDLTREQLLVLIEAMEVGDGWKHIPSGWVRRTVSICTNREVMAGRLQSLCVRRGIRCNLGIAGTDGAMRSLLIAPDKQVWTIATTRKGRPRFSKIHNHPGMVWCIRVATGAIVTRRHGKVAIVGNCGRGTRPLAGTIDGLGSAAERRDAIARSAKPHIEVLDFEGQAGQHKLVTAADVLGGNYDDEVIQLAARAVAEAGGDDVDTREALRDAAKRRHEEKMREMEAEARRRRKLVATAEFSTRSVSPFDILDIEPARHRGWDREPEAASEKQVAALQRWGVPTEGLTKRQASQLMAECIRRRERGLCSYRMAAQLRKRGLDPDMSFEDAKAELDRIAKHENWGSKKAVTA